MMNNENETQNLTREDIPKLRTDATLVTSSITSVTQSFIDRGLMSVTKTEVKTTYWVRVTDKAKALIEEHDEAERLSEWVHIVERYSSGIPFYTIGDSHSEELEFKGIVRVREEGGAERTAFAVEHACSGEGDSGCMGRSLTVHGVATTFVFQDTGKKVDTGSVQFHRDSFQTSTEAAR